MSGATANLPALDEVRRGSGAAASGLSELLSAASAMASGGAAGDSPVASVVTALTGLGAQLDIDVSGLSQRLPQAITTIQHALPEDSLRYIADIEQAYRQVVEFLQHSELVKQIRAGADLEHTALAVIDDVLQLFHGRLGELAANLIGADELARVRQALALIDELRDNYAAHKGELAQLVSQNLLGVAPDLLHGVTAHVDAALGVLAPLSDAALALQVMPAGSAVATAAAAVLPAIRAFDPADPAAYAALDGALQALQVALDAGLDAVAALYAAARTVVDSHAWDAMFTTYRDLLTALPLQQIPTIDDAIDQIAGVLDDFLAQLTMVFSPDELARRVTALSGRLQDAFAQSPVGQARRILVDALDAIRQAIARVPVEAVQQAVAQMLGRIGQELDSLGLDRVQAEIAQGFEAARQFIDDHLDARLIDQVRHALGGLLARLENVPIAEVGQQLSEAVAAAGGVVQDLEGQLHEGLDQLRALLGQLDSVSFKPIADEVIDEIRTLKAKLAAIRPEALSDAEKLALQGGLAVLRALDLEGMIEDQLKRGFTALGDEIQSLIEQVVAAWQALRSRVGDFDPGAVLGPVSSLLDEITRALQGLGGGALLAPLYAVVDELTRTLTALSPGALLAPLDAPYRQMMAVVERVNPDVWALPLRQLHAEIDRLLGLVDITPLLDTLEAKEKELFAAAQQAILGGLDSVHLPAPLDAFYAQLKAVALVLTDAVFGDPAASARALNLRLGSGMSLTTLFQPLDQAFDQLVGMLDRVPPADLVAVMEGLRTGLGVALQAIDPRAVLRQLRAGQGKLAALAPSAILPGLPALLAARGALAARLALAPPDHQAAATALLARFDLVIAPIDVESDVDAAPGSARLHQLQAQHAELVAALRRKINALGSTGAEAAYTQLDANLGRLLPAFLRQPAPLTIADIRAGLGELRPSRKARRLDDSLGVFLAQLAPLQGALEPAMNGFFQAIKDALLIVHPAAIKGAVQAIYDTMRDRLHVLDPEQLAASLRAEVYEPLLAPLAAIDPAVIAAALDGVYQDVAGRLSGQVRGLLDQIKQACDQALGQVRAAVAEVTAALRAQLAAIRLQVQALIGQLDDLIVDDLLGRLIHVIDNLETSFDGELDRVRNEFDAMLNAIPLGGPAGGASAALGR